MCHFWSLWFKALASPFEVLWPQITTIGNSLREELWVYVSQPRNSKDFCSDDGWPPPLFFWLIFHFSQHNSSICSLENLRIKIPTFLFWRLFYIIYYLLGSFQHHMILLTDKRQIRFFLLQLDVTLIRKRKNVVKYVILRN